MQMSSVVLACVFLATGRGAIVAQQSAAIQSHGASTRDLTWSTDAVTRRFVAVHGRRALVMGYPDSGLEIWADPLQLVSDYEVRFMPRSGTFVLDGPSLLRRVEYLPHEIIRTYVGPDFVVHEHIFVPLNEPGAILSYQVEGKSNIDLEVRFRPVLNLMWPAALGGQDTSWNDVIHGYFVREPLHGFSAVIASPETVDHDPVINSTIQTTNLKTLVLRPKPDMNGRVIAHVFVASDPPGVVQSDLLSRLQAHEEQLYAEQAAHYADLLGNAMQIKTPDQEVNRAVASAIVALDQAWVCNPSLGCGEVAGYGPSRGERRPQYAWFFAGDGLVATEALVAADEFARAREELAFIAKYQDKKTGMIWHEISQGVDIDDWKREYPYMFVHVDITFQYLKGVGDYVTASGDQAFLKEQWPGIQAAYRYCRSLLDASTGLPQIPVGREGANEQDRMRDDIGLSSSWVSAAEAYAEMARQMGEKQEGIDAARAADAARKEMASLDWDAPHHFWLEGHSASGEPIYSRRPRPTPLLQQHVFTNEQNRDVLDALASPDFETDWGVRTMSAASAEFDPNSYSKGSVSALGTSSVALAFWNQHRSVIAQQIWSSLLPWNTLDAEGHMHEVLAGDFYHPEIESVPEQTWSSAGFYSATVRGLLGLEVRVAEHQLTFDPHLPPEWDYATINNIRVGQSVLNLRLMRSQDGIELAVENNGPAVSVGFGPEVPLGADNVNASVESSPGKLSRINATVQREGQGEYVNTTFTAGNGSTRCRIRFRGGVSVSVPHPELRIGEADAGLKMTEVSLKGETLSVAAYVKQSAHSLFTVRTGWKLISTVAAEVESHRGDLYTISLRISPSELPLVRGDYMKVNARLTFAKQ